MACLELKRRVWIIHYGRLGSTDYQPYDELPDLSGLPKLLGCCPRPIHDGEHRAERCEYASSRRRPRGSPLRGAGGFRQKRRRVKDQRLRRRPRGVGRSNRDRRVELRTVSLGS